MHGNHIKYMVLGGAAVLAVLALAGVSLGTALTYAIALACPVSMMFMMRGMNHGGADSSHGRTHNSSSHEEPTAPGSRTTTDPESPRRG